MLLVFPNFNLCSITLHKQSTYLNYLFWMKITCSIDFAMSNGILSIKKIISNHEIHTATTKNCIFDETVNIMQCLIHTYYYTGSAYIQFSFTHSVAKPPSIVREKWCRVNKYCMYQGNRVIKVLVHANHQYRV